MASQNNNAKEKLSVIVRNIIIFRVLPVFLIFCMVVVILAGVYQMTIAALFKAEAEEEARRLMPINITGTRRTYTIPAEEEGEEDEKYYRVTLSIKCEQENFVIDGIKGVYYDPGEEFICSGTNEEGEAVTLTCVIESGEIKIEGSIGEIPLSAKGTHSGNRIEATGYYGTAVCSQDVEGMVQFAINIAEDDAHGYSMPNRSCSLCGSDNDDYDCSSLVTAAVAHSGLGGETFLDACENGAFVTATLGTYLEEVGFVKYPYENINSCKRGDILLSPGEHCEIYIGNCMLVGARNDRGHPGEGDQTETEVMISTYWNFATEVWRYEGEID